MNSTLKILGLLGLGAAALLAAFYVGKARAAGIPEVDALTYTGYLEDGDGGALTGEHSIAVRFWESADADDDLCTGSLDTVALQAGRFQIPLPVSCADAVKASPDVWVDVAVDGASLGRTKLGAVPYAIEAGHAAEADHSGSADTATSADSAAVAEALGTLAPGDVQVRPSTWCNAGSSVRSISQDGNVSCEPDDNTTYTPGLGLSLSGTTLSVDPADDADDLVTAASSTAADVTSTTTGPKAFCALSRVRHLGHDDAASYRGCTVTRNGNGTWSVIANAGGTGQSVRCDMWCF